MPQEDSDGTQTMMSYSVSVDVHVILSQEPSGQVGNTIAIHVRLKARKSAALLLQRPPVLSKVPFAAVNAHQ